MNSPNLLNFCYPGLYEIYCEKTQWSYFGHSENVLYRLGRHFNDLQQGKCSDSEKLQQDWLEFGRECFEFRILEAGPHWKDKKKRLARETSYFLTCGHGLYNKFPVRGASLRKECTINGVTYSSGAEAARKLGLSPSSVYRLLKKSNTVTVVLGTKPVSIDGQEFPSLKQAMSLLKISKSTLSRRLQSENFPTWFYLEKTRSNDYPERE